MHFPFCSEKRKRSIFFPFSLPRYFRPRKIVWPYLNLFYSFHCVPFFRVSSFRNLALVRGIRNLHSTIICLRETCEARVPYVTVYECLKLYTLVFVS